MKLYSITFDEYPAALTAVMDRDVSPEVPDRAVKQFDLPELDGLHRDSICGVGVRLLTLVDGHREVSENVSTCNDLT
mgnify:CR=1 FL=1